MSKLATLLLCLLSFQTFSMTKSMEFSIETDQDLYFQIQKITIKEIKPGIETILEGGVDKDLQMAIMLVDGLIAIGKKVWPIIENNKPVVDINNKLSVSVLPVMQNTSPDDIIFLLSHWSAPTKKTYEVSFKNGFGSEVIGFTYSVIYQYGGKYQNKGEYLSGIRVSVEEVNVSWGFDFSAKTSLDTLSNHGSLENPIAGASFNISYIAKSVLKEIRSTDSFHVQGNGVFTKL